MNLKLFMAVPAGRMQGMQPDATGGSGAGQVTLHLTPWRVTSERNALFPEVRQKACPGRVELFLTEKTKLPVFRELYTFPEKNRGGRGKARREQGFDRNSSR